MMSHDYIDILYIPLISLMIYPTPPYFLPNNKLIFKKFFKKKKKDEKKDPPRRQKDVGCCAAHSARYYKKKKKKRGDKKRSATTWVGSCRTGRLATCAALTVTQLSWGRTTNESVSNPSCDSFFFHSFFCVVQKKEKRMK